MPQQDHQVLTLLGQPAAGGQRLGHVALQPLDHMDDTLDLLGHPEGGDDHGDRRADQRQTR